MSISLVKLLSELGGQVREGVARRVTLLTNLGCFGRRGERGWRVYGEPRTEPREKQKGEEEWLTCRVEVGE